MQNEIRDIDIKKTWVLSSTLNFTRYFFKQQYKRKFIVGEHHRLIAEKLDQVLAGKITKLIINIAPRYSKTEMAVKNFIANGLALNPKARFIHLSYSDDLALDNSKAVQEILSEPAYQQLFTTRTISRNAKRWSTNEGGGLYAVSSSGQVTGFGAGIVDDEDETELSDEVGELDKAIDASESFGGAIVIDDPIKPDDALSPTIREKVNRKFETTIRNRVNSRKTPIIIIMQRLNEEDLTGHLRNLEPEDWEVLSIPCIQIDEETGEERALWPFKHSLEELHKIRENNAWVFDTQYMQKPKPLEGLMYENAFKEYDILPATKLHKVKNYTDTADEGADFLCSITYLETEVGNFVLDVLYTQKPMEYTEVKTAEMLSKHAVELAIVESNNGGRGFARNVEKQARLMGNAKTRIKWFHQSDNKNVRIFSHSAEVQNLTYFPHGWERMWPEFYAALTSYMKVGKNDHDDACFIAGTKVATVFGLKDIENVRVGDYIITPFGCRKVIDSGCTGVKQVITNAGITGTENHRVFNKRRWDCLSGINEKSVSLLSFRNLLIWRYKKLLCSMELNTDLWGRENITLVNQRALKGGSVPKDFMLQFGNFITNKKYRKAFVFTTKMAILSITILAIWSVSQSGNTLVNMHKRICKILNMSNETNNNSKRLGKKQRIGMEAKPVNSGIVNIQKNKSEQQKNLFVEIAEMVLNRSCLMPCFAVKNVANNIEENTQESHTRQNVNIAEKNLQQQKLNQASRKSDFAQEVAQIETVQKVYNITVEKDGCYYANGILVSNCDALTGTIEFRAKEGKKSAAGYF